MSARRAACVLSPTHSAGRGVTWLVAGFLFCPCHLPLTLMLLATVFSGTALGALLTGHSYVAGTLITIVWIVMTWRGLRYLQAADRPKA
jgi:Fe2+ transport system protein B